MLVRAAERTCAQALDAKQSNERASKQAFIFVYIFAFVRLLQHHDFFVNPIAFGNFRIIGFNGL